MKQTIFILLLLVSTLLADSQNKGIVDETLLMKSTILNREVNYSIYLPDDYNTSSIRYPVLFLLHGYSDNHTAWIQFGQMNRILDKCIDEGTAPAMIVVMPDAKTTWYINNANGKDNYEDMFVQELIPYIDATYRTRPIKEARAIAGLSMGGYGSMLYALKYPDLFAACCPLSAGIYVDKEWDTMPTDRYKTVFNAFDQTSKARLNNHWYTNSTIKLVQDMPESQKFAVRFYLDCGDDDFLFVGNSSLYFELRKKGIPCEYRVRDGGHTWEYWRTALPEVFNFIGKSFHR